MPYNIADPGRDLEELVVRHAHVFREKQGIDLRTGHFVDMIDRSRQEVKGKTLEGKDFSIGYDKLLIATGASPKLPELPGTDLSGVMVLKTLEEGRKLKDFLGRNNVRKAVIMGMGYIAMEMTEAFHARGIQVDMVKPRPELLPWMNREMASVVREEIERHGVNLYTGQEIEGIEERNTKLRVVCPDVTLEGEMVLAAIGVTPNSDAAARAGLKLGPSKAIEVDRTMRTSDKEIYAAGDCADAFHVVTGKKTWIPLALYANRSGWAAADNITGKRAEVEGVAGTSVFKVFDLEVARTGLSMAEAEEAGFEPVEMMIKSRTRAHAHPGASQIYVQLVGDKKTGRLLGAQLVGREGAAHRTNAVAVALQQGMTVEDYCQCDLAYAPPFGPTWDPTLTAANQLYKSL